MRFTVSTPMALLNTKSALASRACAAIGPQSVVVGGYWVVSTTSSPRAVATLATFGSLGSSATPLATKSVEPFWLATTTIDSGGLGSDARASRTRVGTYSFGRVPMDHAGNWHS